MQKFTKIASIIAILVSSPLTYAQEGEFTIDITGPDEVYQNEPVAQPRPAPARVAPARPATVVARPTAAPAVAPATTVTPVATPTVATNTAVATTPTQVNTQNVAMQGTRVVRNQDTIWSIASSLVPANRANNEYQIIAAIYRYNPQAFRNGDINQLIQGATLNIPSYADISKETTKSGSDLLQGITKTLPPIVNNTKAPVANRQNIIQDTQLEDNIDSLISQLRQENAQSPQNAVSFARVPVVNNNDTPKTTDEINQNATNLQENKQDQAVAEALNAAVENQNKTVTPPIPINAESVDIGAIFKILDDLETQIDKQQDKVDQDIAKALVRSETAAKNTARSTVENVMNNYDNIILELQQSNAELRSTIAKLNQQLDQVREFTLSTNDQIAGLESRVMGISPQNNISNQGPLMMILLGGGLLALIMAVTLFFFKRKSNQATKELTKDDYVVEDDFGTDDVLITSTIGPSKEEIANAEKEYQEEQAKKKQEAEEQAKRDAATKAAAEALKAQKKGAKYVDDEIQIPENLQEGNKNNVVNTDVQAEQAKKAWNEAKETSEKKNEQIAENDNKATVSEVSADTVAEPKSDDNQVNVLADNDIISTAQPTQIVQATPNVKEQVEEVATSKVSVPETVTPNITETATTTQTIAKPTVASAPAVVPEVNTVKVASTITEQQAKKEEKSKDKDLLAQWANMIDKDDLSDAVQINRDVSSENKFIDTDSKTQQPLTQEAKTLDEVFEDQARQQDALKQELKQQHDELEAQKKFDDLDKLLQEDDNHNLHLEQFKQAVQQKPQEAEEIPELEDEDEPDDSYTSKSNLDLAQFKQAIQQDVEQSSTSDIPLQSSQAEEELFAKFSKEKTQNTEAQDTLSAKHLSNALEGKEDEAHDYSSLAEQEFRQSLQGDTDIEQHDKQKELDLLGPKAIGDSLATEDDVIRPEFNFKNKISVEDALKSLESEEHTKDVSSNVDDEHNNINSDVSHITDTVTTENGIKSKLDDDLVLDDQDHDILNMLKDDKNDEDVDFAKVLKETQQADDLTDDQIANMISSSNGQEQVQDSEPDIGVLDKTDDALVEDMHDAPEHDMFNSKSDTKSNNKTLSEMDIQRYNDELNLAHLYFETGDTDEAMNIVNEVLDKGNDELIKKANELLTTYGQ